jgi:hypothetical protein
MGALISVDKMSYQVGDTVSFTDSRLGAEVYTGTLIGFNDSGVPKYRSWLVCITFPTKLSVTLQSSWQPTYKFDDKYLGAQGWELFPSDIIKLVSNCKSKNCCIECNIYNQYLSEPNYHGKYVCTWCRTLNPNKYP